MENQELFGEFRALKVAFDLFRKEQEYIQRANDECFIELFKVIKESSKTGVPISLDRFETIFRRANEARSDVGLPRLVEVEAPRA